MAYNPIQLPYRLFDEEDLVLRVQKNFEEVEFFLGQLQINENKIGLPINLQVSTSSTIWERAENINPDGTINTEKLTNKLVGLDNELQLAASAVTSAALAVSAIGSIHITDEAITSAKLALSAVTAEHISDGAITSAKLALESIGSNMIADGAITSAKLAFEAISENHIKPGSIPVFKTKFPYHQIY